MFDNVLAQFGLEGGKVLIDVRNGAGGVVGVVRANGKSGPFGMVNIVLQVEVKNGN